MNFPSTLIRYACRLASVAFLSVCCLTSNAQTGDINENWTFWSDRNPAKATVTLPHDAMMTEQRSADAPEGRHNGFFPGGTYHYERTIDVPQAWLTKHVTLHFDGVYRNATVLLNGTKMATHCYGYTPFDVVLDGKFQAGHNTIRVDADNSQVPNSRWYSGAGIYRPVRLTVQAPTHIIDTRITTRSISPAIVTIATKHSGGRVVCDLLWKNQVVAHGEGDNMTIEVPDAHLWSADEPNLYQVRVRVMEDGVCTDSLMRDYGLRQITWSPKGLFVNGKQVLLRGGCLHHDNGILGAREYDDAAMRKVAIMKQYGYNAIRSSHNPTSEAMLQACDRLGMYVMDELWDMWYSTKTPNDYARDWDAHHDEDMQQLVARDYNHPSVIIYSVGNEVTEPYEEKGVETAQQLVDRMHQLDATRPVTCGINLTLLYLRKRGMNLTQSTAGPKRRRKVSSEDYNNMIAQQGRKLLEAVRLQAVDSISTPVLDKFDIAGYNYGSLRYEQESTAHPGRIIAGTESYCQDIFDNWQLVEQLPYLIGDFMWTAWDYLGEVGVGQWVYTAGDQGIKQQYPSKLAHAGAIDLIGNPTGEAFWAKAVWQHDGKPYIAVRPVSRIPLVKAIWRGTNSIPSWSWKGMDGVMATVEVFTSAKTVKLYLNDNFIGEKTVQKHVTTFEIPYAPGTLRAVAIDGQGKEQTATLTSASGKLGILAKTEKDTYHVGDLIYLDVDIADQRGIVEANAEEQLTVSVKGADLLAFGSAQPITADRFTTGTYTTFYGRSQAVLRATRPGKIVVTIKGNKLSTARYNITVK